MADTQGELSKSAKRRAAKKARDAAAEAEQPAPAVEAAPKAKAKAKSQAAAPAGASAPAAAGYPDANAKAKAKAKAEPKAPEPSPPAQAEPKAKAKAKAEPKQQSKSVAKAAQQPAAKKQEEEEPVKEKNDEVRPYEVDDGSGPAWDVCDGLNAKQRRRQVKIQEEKKMAELAKAQGFAAGNKHIPGLGVVDPNQGRIPGMAPQGTVAKGAVSQSVNAVPAVATKEEAAPKVQSSTASVKVPEARIGVCIGPKGATLKLIQEKTGTRIDTTGEMFTITGPAEGVQQAEVAINDLASKGYTPLQYEDFNENYVMVAKESFPDLIGKKGCVVQAMKKELGVEVTIAGRSQSVEKAKEVINDIIMYGHHEVTHPGETHEEVEVPEWAYSAIIGKKGSELRHMQNCHSVRVCIPRENSANQNVVIVGEPLGVTRCKAHVEKLVYNFTNQSRGRERQDQAEDGWGDEGEVEDWMKAYMYKR